MCDKTPNGFSLGYLIIALILLISGGFAEDLASASHETANYPMTLDLSGPHWQMEGIRAGQDSISSPIHREIPIPGRLDVQA